MRHHINILHPLFALLLLAACSSEGDTALPEQPTAEQLPCIYRMTLRAAVEGYDDTRAATPYAFQSGDRVHVLFQLEAQGTVTGIATYSATTDEWTVTTTKRLPDTDDGVCSLAFVPGLEPDMFAKEVALTSRSCVYVATAAIYQCYDGTLNVQGTLAPALGRIRFHGAAGQKSAIAGLSFPASFSLESHTVSCVTDAVIATCGDDGFTPYYYATFADAAAPQLIIDNRDDSCSFRKSFDRGVLAMGRSGYLDIPTTTLHDGWNPVDEDPLGLCPDSRHPHAIDMGGGLKWACCNVGATMPVEYGGYFAWGETATKTAYDWSTYKYGNGQYSLTKYCTSSSYGTVDNRTWLEAGDDAARANWGGRWRMPSYEEFEELVWSKGVTRSWEAICGVNGYKVTATNGNTLFFPAAGSYEYRYTDFGSRCCYWSASLNTSSPSHSPLISFNDYGGGLTSGARYLGQSVRPVTE